jgi:dTDP-4-dehydrorhamnose 3,5-epimerase
MKIKPKIFKIKKLSDKRGSFSKLLSSIQNQKIFKKEKIREINFSFNNKKGTVRGFHYQTGKFREIKLVYCLSGQILDVIVNINKKSKDYKKIYKFNLDERKKEFLMIPKNYAHGFQTLKDNTILLYLHSSKYNKKFERRINPIKNDLNFNWPKIISNISKKDSEN